MRANSLSPIAQDTRLNPNQHQVHTFSLGSSCRVTVRPSWSGRVELQQASKRAALEARCIS